MCVEILAVFIRNSKNTNGLNISGTEFLISQYADDTTFILDRSTKYFDHAHAKTSGLKIIYSKSKVIWIFQKRFIMK